MEILITYLILIIVESVYLKWHLDQRQRNYVRKETIHYPIGKYSLSYDINIFTAIYKYLDKTNIA